jgi:hypothetical protein
MLLLAWRRSRWASIGAEEELASLDWRRRGANRPLLPTRRCSSTH